MIKKKQPVVFCMMSGGVDSSVAAALLKKRGYRVVGVYMKGWSPPETIFQDICTWARDQEDARRAAARLGIAFYTFNFEQEYYQAVVRYLLAEYRAGRTPNPDVVCNQAIKFGVFFDRALALGADYVASGHYARIARGVQGGRGVKNVQKPSARLCEKPIPPRRTAAREYRLLAGADPNKDQSYFLYRLTQRQLRRTLFPVGDYQKPAVRELARRFGLPTADKKDSQGVCFIGKLDMAAFLRHYLPIKPGAVVTTAGRRVGRQDGVWFYTIGQRQGLGIGGGTPYYVVNKDLKSNRLIVSGGGHDPALYATAVLLEAPHWIGRPPVLPRRLKARLRYRQALQAAGLRRRGRRLVIVFDRPQRAVTPGQMCVFYEGDRVLGGAVIAGAAGGRRLQGRPAGRIGRGARSSR